MNKDKIIVVPDIHGRKFWEIIKNKQYNDYEIVFLGDYLDIYPYEEGIGTNKDAIDNFKNIIKFAKSNKDRVHLLIGNHDIHYFGYGTDTCRMDIQNLGTIFNIYNDNKNLFNVAYKWNNTLFTHAGVTTKWISQTFDNIIVTKDNIVALLNNELHNKEWEKPIVGFYEIRNYNGSWLGDIGRSRGGYAPYGSCLWCDADEMYYHSAFFDVINTADTDAVSVKLDIQLYQITGHTQLKETGTFSHPQNNWWMCDSRKAFIWDEKNETLSLL